MAKKLVEFVPNFSEGRDKDKVEKIVDEARKIKGLKILDYSSDADHNRSVVTIIGTPEAVTEAAINMAKVAIQLIDMRTHHGAHPRFGAVDVVPFTPVMGVTMDECVALPMQWAKPMEIWGYLSICMKMPAPKKPVGTWHLSGKDSMKASSKKSRIQNGNLIMARLS